jgi:hypothetical protein
MLQNFENLFQRMADKAQQDIIVEAKWEDNTLTTTWKPFTVIDNQARNSLLYMFAWCLDDIGVAYEVGASAETHPEKGSAKYKIDSFVEEVDQLATELCAGINGKAFTPRSEEEIQLEEEKLRSPSKRKGLET